ncbi:MAG: type II toxin-antitoxin system mRNA interferase toxin, RelE/StbE family [Waddliaceae bacterium]|nr:type II toxin-antitoxin system mRNA interferase toxin, RelE/StbE family [Waddliaceae bacterium]|tara:strand:- start:226 stop:492 length:267 start_codon:yes stop_codon:yes gene_type:complete
MSYQIKIVERLQKKLQKIPSNYRERILFAIDCLEHDPRPDGCKKLKGSRQPILYRIRVGDYRIVYEIRDSVLLILILELGHRKDMYRQ